MLHAVAIRKRANASCVRIVIRGLFLVNLPLLLPLPSPSPPPAHKGVILGEILGLWVGVRERRGVQDQIP